MDVWEKKRPSSTVTSIIRGQRSTDKFSIAILAHLFCPVCALESSTCPEQMNYAELAKRADYFKAEAEGVNAMCELMEKFGEKKMEEGRLEGRAEGRAEGHREGMLDMARSLRKLNVPLEVIEKSSGLTRAEILGNL